MKMISKVCGNNAIESKVLQNLLVGSCKQIFPYHIFRLRYFNVFRVVLKAFRNTKQKVLKAILLMSLTY